MQIHLTNMKTKRIIVERIRINRISRIWCVVMLGYIEREYYIMSMSWINVDWFKRKLLHEYQNGGNDATQKYLKEIAKAVNDSDYVLLLEYANGLTPADTNPDKSEEDRLWRI